MRARGWYSHCCMEQHRVFVRAGLPPAWRFAFPMQVPFPDFLRPDESVAEPRPSGGFLSEFTRPQARDGRIMYSGADCIVSRRCTGKRSVPRQGRVYGAGKQHDGESEDFYRSSYALESAGRGPLICGLKMIGVEEDVCGPGCRTTLIVSGERKSNSAGRSQWEITSCARSHSNVTTSNNQSRQRFSSTIVSNSS